MVIGVAETALATRIPNLLCEMLFYSSEFAFSYKLEEILHTIEKERTLWPTPTPLLSLANNCRSTICYTHKGS